MNALYLAYQNRVGKTLKYIEWKEVVERHSEDGIRDDSSRSVYPTCMPYTFFVVLLQLYGG